MLNDKDIRDRGAFVPEWLDTIPLLRVLHEYKLMDQMIERGPAAWGRSPFTGGVLGANLRLNVWNDSRGRPVVDGEVVAVDIVGLVQALEGVSRERALKILHERFVVGIRCRARVLLEPKPQSPTIAELEGLIADVPYLRRLGVPPEVAEHWGVGWCPKGPMAGRIVFPVRRPTGRLVGYAGLDPTDAERWQLSEGLDPARELFGIERIYRDPKVQQLALAWGVTLTGDPLAAMRTAQTLALPVVSPISAELNRAQVEALLDRRAPDRSRTGLAGCH